MRDHRRAQLLRQLSRFGLAGLINTAVGLTVTGILDLGFGLNPHLANAGGYCVGLASSFFLNRSFVFKNSGPVAASGARYAAVIGLAFGANQAVLTLAGALLNEQPISRLTAQVLAMATYTVLQFVLLRLWVFRDQGKREVA